MRVFFVLLFLFVLFCGYVCADVVQFSCDDEGYVLVKLRYFSDSQIELSTAVESRSLQSCSGCLVFVKGYCEGNTSYVSYSSLGSHVLVNVLAVEKYYDEVGFNFLMGLAGLLASGLLFYSIQNAFLN